MCWMRAMAALVESKRSLSMMKSSSELTRAMCFSTRFRLLTITSSGLLISCATPTATSPSVTRRSWRRIARRSLANPMEPTSVPSSAWMSDPEMATGSSAPLRATKVVSKLRTLPGICAPYPSRMAVITLRASSRSGYRRVTCWPSTSSCE